MKIVVITANVVLGFIVIALMLKTLRPRRIVGRNEALTPLLAMTHPGS